MHGVKTILITGGCGFLGSNFIKMIIQEHPDIEIVNLDSLTGAANLDNLRSVMHSPKYRFVRGNIRNERIIEEVLQDYGIEGIVNFAAETNVRRSIEKPIAFIDTNISGTVNLLQQAVKAKVKRFLQVSTDKVYGVCSEDTFPDETSEIKPDSPYAASKGFADYFVQFFHKTYGLNTVITRGCNSFGPNQFPSKFIPTAFMRADKNRSISVYGGGTSVRDWLHVHDHCSAIWLVFRNGKPGELYNVGGFKNNNLEVVKLILSYLGRGENLIQFVETPAGHGLCYRASTEKIKQQLGWQPSMKFDEGFIKTLGWYYNNDEWLEKVVSGEYLTLFNQLYQT